MLKILIKIVLCNLYAEIQHMKYFKCEQQWEVRSVKNLFNFVWIISDVEKRDFLKSHNHLPGKVRRVGEYRSMKCKNVIILIKKKKYLEQQRIQTPSTFKRW